MALKFDERGLIPAIVQDYRTRDVLMLAYMNAESLAISIAERRVCFYSRSRQTLWRKGETSGNILHIASITADCDGDALLIQAKADGPACHTGATSCFFDEIYLDHEVRPFALQALYGVIADRRAHPKEGSYTTYLFEKGRDKILKKVGEECAEVLIAGAKNDEEETVYEIGDLVYHVMALMAEMDIPLRRVIDELARRHVVDHKIKQERMQ